MSTTRIYRVTDLSAASGFSLVRAASQSQAVSTVVNRRYTVRTATQDDIVEGLTAGVPVLDAKPESAGA